MQKIFVQACHGEPTSHTPIWLNRQAGRYMPEYHQVKGQMPSLDFFKNPEKAATATLDAQRILGVDAAIMFADILPILEPMGMSLEYVPGEGPVFANPLRHEQDVAQLTCSSAEEATPYIEHTVKNILADLPGDIALIGFAGAPFTLASYAIEGKGSRNYVFVKKMMHQRPILWQQLMAKLVSQLTGYLQMQIDAGVDAIQLFDTWVGNLSTQDFQVFVAPYLAQLRNALNAQVPIIYFGTGNAHLLPEVKALGFDVLAFDWRTPLVSTWDQLGVTAVQGNLDPIVLCTDTDAIRSQSKWLLDQVAGRPGHIFNLGHGIIPETPVDNVKFLVDFVQSYSQGQRG
ncbi:MAG TPA: uroporphyrinogen decarboxylase [Gammaproteobacteria bacterium]|nr:uroporphyrinogen decarboxylase [Gammaproteobacteria bacterium]|tara:strand:- start:6621 stop:7652 length:1032 start_codon:yes stop_codon:yes gene_type:complete